MDLKFSLDTNYGYTLIIENDNIRLTEDIESRTKVRVEFKGERRILTERDVSTESLGNITHLLSEMIYHRKGLYDSSELVRGLFDKLPNYIAESLAEELYKTYRVEDDE